MTPLLFFFFFLMSERTAKLFFSDKKIFMNERRGSDCNARNNILNAKHQKPYLETRVRVLITTKQRSRIGFGLYKGTYGFNCRVFRTRGSHD